MKTAYKISISVIALLMMSGLSSAHVSSNNSLTKGGMSLYELIITKGGFVIYPLAVISVLTVILIFFFLITIRRRKVVSDRFMANAEILIHKKDYLGLVAQCNNSGESMARITERAVIFMTKNTGVAISDVRDVAEAEGSRQSGMLNNRISYLSDIGSIATMMGLLGTVIGMIETFMSISQGNVDGVQQMKVAEGVYPALITTGMGLSIGIVAMIFYSFFRGKVQKYVSELEAAATHLLALISAQHNRSAMLRSERMESNRNFYDRPDDMGAIGDDFAMPEQQGGIARREDPLDQEGIQGPLPMRDKRDNRTVEGI